VPPKIRRDGIDMNPRIRGGATLQLRCEADGKPTPKITWMSRARDDSDADAIVIGPENAQMGNIELTNGGSVLKVRVNISGGLHSFCAHTQLILYGIQAYKLDVYL
jgi:hypothetical protein